MSCVTISPGRFKKKQLRAHTIFSDATIHDVWAFELPTGFDRTMVDLRDVLSGSGATRANFRVRFLFGMRRLVGILLGWDRKPATPDPSYTDRLSPQDRAESLVEPGSDMGEFKTVYVHANEAADEISNRLVHAVSVMAIEPLSEGYTVYWAIYLRRASRAYMRLIDPFRKRYVYPAVIDRFQRRWLERFPQQTQRVLGSERPRHEGAGARGS